MTRGLYVTSKAQADMYGISMIATATSFISCHDAMAAEKAALTLSQTLKQGIQQLLLLWSEQMTSIA